MTKIKEVDIVDENNKTDNDEKLFIKTERKNKNKKSNNKFSIIISCVITFIICLILFGLFYKYYLTELVIEKTILEKNVTITDAGIADAVEKVYDSVVVIETYVNDKAYASGTGFVFKEDKKNGYILTNNHVITNATSVKVTLTNDKKIDAHIVGSDEYSDIAVLAISKDDVIATATLGSSEKMRVGDTTFAVGAPLDASVYSWSVTRGILSGKNRLVEVSTGNNNNSFFNTTSNTFLMEVLQTDTAINSGNSGGPLCNSNGEVIGVTNMKLASSSVEGMGFAIPIEQASSYADSIISGTKIIRPYLGVSVYDGTSFFNLTSSGVYVQYVEENSPAGKAGIKSGDKILKINSAQISDTSHFKYELYKYKIGEKIKVTVERNGDEKELNVTLGSNETVN